MTRHALPSLHPGAAVEAVHGELRERRRRTGTRRAPIAPLPALGGTGGDRPTPEQAALAVALDGLRKRVATAGDDVAALTAAMQDYAALALAHDVGDRAALSVGALTEPADAAAIDALLTRIGSFDAALAAEAGAAFGVLGAPEQPAMSFMPLPADPTDDPTHRPKPEPVPARPDDAPSAAAEALAWLPPLAGAGDDKIRFALVGAATTVTLEDSIFDARALGLLISSIGGETEAAPTGDSEAGTAAEAVAALFTELNGGRLSAANFNAGGFERVEVRRDGKLTIYTI